MKKAQEIVSDVYASNSQSQLNQYYRDWAQDYDNDTLVEMGYKAAEEAATDLFEMLPDTSAKVLDLGAGTGLVGEYLTALGYKNLDAFDASQDMLNVATGKNIYRNLIHGELGTGEIGIDPKTYDATICVGTYTFGHVGPQALEEVLDITKPDGMMCFTQRLDFYDDQKIGFKAEMQRLEAIGRMGMVFRSEPRSYLPLTDPDSEYATWIYRRF